jgi:hypothetical protein
MPMKLNVGVSQKVGLPNYGSVGASCNLEMELDAGLLEKDLDGFHARIRAAYVAAHQAVHDELARLHAPTTNGAGSPSLARAGASIRNGTTRVNGNGTVATRVQSDRTRAPRPATANQVKAIQAIARRQNTDLVGLLRHEYEIERPDDLSISQASELIDLLKNQDTA